MTSVYLALIYSLSADQDIMRPIINMNCLFIALLTLPAVSSFLGLAPMSPHKLRNKQLQGIAHDDEDFPAAVDRRDAILRSIPALTLSVPFAVSAASSPFEGTYTDPINHPGGTRTIKILNDEKSKVGDYQLAEVQGGGGVGEPKSYVLPAVILGDRAIVIDFSPKGGPRDFTGVLKNGDIVFLRDGNRWPRQKQ